MSRVAIVTGGTRGIGAAISVALKKAGYLVAANYAGNDERARGFSDRTGIAAFKWDVSSFEECQKGVAAVESQLGPIDVIVNNAGITRDATMKKMNRIAWDEVLDTNLGGCFNMSKAAWDGMLARSFGRIVNIGSINGQAGQYGQVNYAAAKSGIHGFTKALAQEGASRASPSTPSRPAISTPTWSPRFRPKCSPRSWRAFRWDVSARPRRSRAPSCSWWRTRAASSPDRRFPSTVASTCIS